MNTHHFGKAALNEVMNGGIVYGPNGNSRAAVYGHRVIMSRGNVQHSLHVESKMENLQHCWSALLTR